MPSSGHSLRGGDLFARLLVRPIALVECGALAMIRLENRFPPLFIVGVPRSGTTVMYLHLVNLFQFAYFPNASKWHPSACVSVAALARVFHRYRPTYDSSYGIVAGPMAPSDGWNIFHRWFPRYDHSQEVLTSRLYELKNIVRLMELIFQAPFINKNNSNSVRIEYLSRLFPQALFVHVTRDIRDTVLSLLEGRKLHQVSLNDWWGVAPPQLYGHSFRSHLEQCVCQVLAVDTCIRQALARIPSDQWCVMPYEQFCEQPAILEQWVRSQYAKMQVNLKRTSYASQLSLKPRTRAHPPEFEKQITDILGEWQSKGCSS